jgi:2-dehydro-3-deoxyphosphogalactonate aldolase
MKQFSEYFESCPLIAILRGIKPNEILTIGEALIEAGFRIIEIPLNSPEALKSIELAANHFTEDILVGAGTVLNTDQVRKPKHLISSLFQDSAPSQRPSR